MRGAWIHQLKYELAQCKQRGLSVESYYAKLNTLWQELDALYHQRIHYNCKCDIQKLREEEKVHQLLMGLDDTIFANARSALLAMDPLPSLNQAYSALIQEEVAHNPFLKFPEEIVDEILMRLPPKPLFMLKSVSIRFKSFVTDPKFAQKYMIKRADKLKGMLYPRIEHSLDVNANKPGCTKIIFPSPHIDHIQNHFIFFYTTNASPSATILASSNGLILSWSSIMRIGDYNSNRIDLWLSNPLINKSFNLPRIYGPKRDVISRAQWTCSLVTRIGSSSSSYKVEYKVVLILRPERSGTKTDSATIKIFSSDTGAWIDVVSKISCPRVVFRNFLHGPDFSYKGILHWIDDSCIVTYNPYDSPDRFGHILLPNANNNVGSRKILNLFHLDHEDVVKCCEIERSSTINDDLNLNLLVWRIVDYGKGEWCLEQRCRISPLCGGGGEGSLLKGCRQVIGPDPWDPEGGFCYVFARDNRVTVVDIGSGKEEDVNVPRVFYNAIIPGAFDRLPLVPLVYCPWSSPCPDQRPVLPGKMAMKRKLGFFGTYH